MNAIRFRSPTRAGPRGRGLLATAAASLTCYWLALQSGAPARAPVEAVAPSREALELQVSFGRIAERVRPAVVSIRTIHYAGPKRRSRLPRPPAQPWVEGIGSGVLVDPRGYILTNEHVVHGADRIEITVLDPTPQEYAASLVHADAELDLALLKVPGRRTFSYASLGDSSRVRVGDWAVAVGNPFGLQQTVTVGVISAVRQSFRVEQHVYTDFFQTDAAINRGNSGGPLVNLRGEIIGINTAIYGPTGVFTGIGFAIPSNQARGLVNPLTVGREETDPAAVGR
ncbi:MAG: trypsin-like peptidase domain-containing protein [Elusimicrobia bacterium]|nr:trypsin-like peptidase domain-containing protein [Elusimicrobiota bacterium]